MNRKEETINRFDADAKAYDDRIIKHVNGYLDMHQSLFNFIPFKKDDSFTILDLGIGSGKLSAQILEAFPNSKLIGIDFSDKMLEMSKFRLRKHENRFELINSDFEKSLPKIKFGIVIMVLALHHLEDPGKEKLIKKLYSQISSPGALLIGDLTKSVSQKTTDKYMNLWRQNLRNNGYSEEHIENTYKEKYLKEDIPTTLENHLKWLREAGFDQVEVLWKRYHFMSLAAFKGVK